MWMRLFVTALMRVCCGSGVTVLTGRGREVLRDSIHILHMGYWMRRFFTERVCIAFSALFLVVLAAAELWVGWMIGSGGLFSEGVENLTDLFKVGIIGLSVRFNRDRLGAIVIIGLYGCDWCVPGVERHYRSSG